MNLIILFSIIFLSLLSHSQTTPPEKVYASILKREKLSPSDSKKLRIYLNTHMAAAFTQRLMSKENQDLLTYASLYSLYESTFKNDVELDKHWKQQALLPKAPEAEKSEEFAFTKLKKLVSGPDYIKTVNDYYNLIKSINLKSKLSFLIFRCEALSESGLDAETKQCFSEVDRVIRPEDPRYQVFSTIKFVYYLGTNDLRNARETASTMIKLSGRVDFQNRWKTFKARAEYADAQYDQALATIKDIVVGQGDSLLKANLDLFRIEVLSAKGQNLEALKNLKELVVTESQKNTLFYFYRVAYIYFNAGDLIAAQENTEKAILGIVSEPGIRLASQMRLSLVALKTLNKSPIASEQKKFFEDALSNYKLYKSDNSHIFDMISAGHILTQNNKPDPKVVEPILTRIVKESSKNNLLAVLSKLNFNLK